MWEACVVHSKGNITFSDVYQILPFENSLCIVTLKGSDLQSLKWKI